MPRLPRLQDSRVYIYGNIVTYVWRRAIDHAQALIGYLQNARLSRGRVAVFADYFADRLADDAGALVGECLNGAQVAQQVALLLDQLHGRIELVVVQVDGIGRGKDALSAGAQIDALAPQVLGLLLHIDGIADLQLDLVMVSRHKLVQSPVCRLQHLQLAEWHAAKDRRKG